MAWYEDSPKQVEDERAKAAIRRYNNSRTASEANPRAHVFGAVIVGVEYLAKLKFKSIDKCESDGDLFGVRLHRALITKKSPDGAGEIEFEVMIGVGVDRQMNDVPGTYFAGAKVEWK